MSEWYHVPSGNSEIELVEKRSRFIGRVWLADDEVQALTIISEIRRKHWDASHNVYAYAIRGGAARFSDDGEPSGTAGKPIFEVFSREGITNYLCIVTRYFGGTLLGAGGLVRAYTATAKAALDAAGITVIRPYIDFSAVLEYPILERVKLEIEAADGIIDGVDYAADVTLKFRIPLENTDSFRDNVTELSAGKIVL